MAYEYPTELGSILIYERPQGVWTAALKGRSHGTWPSADHAAKAISRHASGLATWNRRQLDVSSDLIDWRPLGASL